MKKQKMRKEANYVVRAILMMKRGDGDKNE